MRHVSGDCGPERQGGEQSDQEAGRREQSTPVETVGQDSWDEEWMAQEPLSNPEEGTGSAEDGRGGADQTAELASLREENRSLTERLLRLQADFDNYRRRVRRDQEDWVRYAGEKVITELLPILDNFERALAAGKQGGDLEGFLNGVAMILRQLHEVFARQGVEAIDTVNKSFDPNLHHAVARVGTQDTPEGTVVDELQRGYILHDRVIRPAMVRVAAAGNDNTLGSVQGGE